MGTDRRACAVCWLPACWSDTCCCSSGDTARVEQMAAEKTRELHEGERNSAPSSTDFSVHRPADARRDCDRGQQVGLGVQPASRRPTSSTCRSGTRPGGPTRRSCSSELREAVKQAAQGEFVRMEATHRAANGELHWIDFSLKPVKDETGKVVFLIPEGRDITERKRAEEALQRRTTAVADHARPARAGSKARGLRNPRRPGPAIGRGAVQVPVDRAAARPRSRRRAGDVRRGGAAAPRGDGRDPPADQRLAAAGSRRVGRRRRRRLS